MAVLDASHADKGNLVQVALADGGVANATVADFPAYDPQKKRPRS
jgi:glycine cleavage system aminomethyltransferase T